MDAAVAQFDDAEVRLIMILSYTLSDSQTKRTNLIPLSIYLWSFFNRNITSLSSIRRAGSASAMFFF